VDEFVFSFKDVKDRSDELNAALIIALDQVNNWRNFVGKNTLQTAANETNGLTLEGVDRLI